MAKGNNIGNVEKLRREIGASNLIGCYTIRKDGSTCFADIRGAQGNLIPNINEIEYHGRDLKEGVFYSFSWHLEDDNADRIIIDGTPAIFESKELLKNLFEAKLHLEGGLLQQYNNFQKTIFSEVTGARHTYIYELLQNANDYPHNQEQVDVKFILTDHYLFFFHSGAYFNLRNIVGISSINNGEKSGNIKTIGYKGIGFKSVFVNNDYVFLRSGEWSLRFDKNYTEQFFGGDCPWSLMPISTDIEELDKEVHDVLKSFDMHVQFALRHKTDARENIEQLDKVFSDNQILLFIPHVCRVEVIVDGMTRHLVCKDENKWVVTNYRYKVPEDLKLWVSSNVDSGNKIPEKFKDIDNIAISFAIGRDGKKLLPIENARVYNYLPTELRLGFEFLFNADFVPNGSRSGLHDVVWNDRIMEQCGQIFADWWVSFLREEGEYDMESVFSILPELENRDNYAKLFLKGFCDRISEMPCIPTLKDGVYHLVKISDVLYDKIGFVASENPVLSDELLYDFSDTTGALPHPSIRTCSKLKMLLNHFNCSITFTNNDLDTLCTEIDFQNWLKEKENNLRFFEYILHNDLIGNLWNYPIFLQEDGNVRAANKMYYDIDRYYEDIKFLASDLPRLDVEIRDTLAANHKDWGSYQNRFKQFQDFAFIKNIFDHFAEYDTLFHVKENSINFIHFLAIVGNKLPLPQIFPLFNEKGRCVQDRDTIFQKSTAAQELSQFDWIKDEWLEFIDNDYLKKDTTKVSNYLSNECNVLKLNTSDCIRRFISNKLYVTEIANAIKHDKHNKEFYLYLATHLEDLNEFSSIMREHYTLKTTDGKSEGWSLIRKTIFFKDDEWKKYADALWMPAGSCLAICDYYFDGVSNEDRQALESLFRRKQIVQRFSILGLHQSIRPKMSEILSKITSKEASKDFLNYLFLNRQEIFKNEPTPKIYQQIAILCIGEERLQTIESYKGYIYLPNKDCFSLYNQPWFPKERMAICDKYYQDLFDGTERCEFFKELGIKPFEKMHYVRAHLLTHLDKIKPLIMEHESNIAFHHYLSDIHEELSDRDLEKVKDLPIFIFSSENEEGVFAEKSGDHYIPSELLTNINSRDLVPISILDSIHPSYIRNDADKKYFLDKLGNADIDEESFYDYIVGEDNLKIVDSYLRDEQRNIRFWRWICDSKVGRDKKAALKVLPILARNIGDENDHFNLSSKLYISGVYTKVSGIEIFVKENVDNPSFISTSYLEEGVERDWLTLFKTLKVKVDIKDIIFGDVLKNLAKYKNVDIVPTLAKYHDTFASKLKDGDETTMKYLNQLQLLCNDGEYRTPKEVLISGKYFDFDINPFPDIIIGNLVSEEYLNIDNADAKRNVVKFIKLIADHYNVKCENATQLRDEKLRYFSKHQDHYAASDAHYHIIAELAKIYYEDSVGTSDLLRSMVPIKLFTTTGELTTSYTLYLSTVYCPICQYMANGVKELRFVSEKYDEFYEKIKPFFICLGVLQDFNFNNLQLLRNEEFAIYFWEDYVCDKEDLKDILTEKNLRNIPCIPTSLGLKKPNELYDYRNSQLNKIVLKLKDGQNKLPNISLPKWIEHIGFRSRLYILDCLEYLNLNTTEFRTYVIKWIIDTPDEILQKHKQTIRKYCTSAQWFNGAKQLVPLQSLYALEWGNKTLKDCFGGNAAICDLSKMPETQQDYNRLCKLFDIKILKNSDFKKRKEGDYRCDTEAIREIDKRLLYLAYKADQKNWEELYEGYKERLKNADICSCERIAYFFNDDIKRTLRIYAEEATALWYVGSWKGSMFLDILDWIVKKIDIKGSFDRNFLIDLFQEPFDLFIQKEEGGSLPEDVLDCLNESDRYGINIDKYKDDESFIEYKYDLDELPAESVRKIINKDSKHHETTENSYIQDNYSVSSNIDPKQNGISDEEHRISTPSETEMQNITKERKLRSDFGGTHNRGKKEHISNREHSNHTNNETKNKQTNVFDDERPIEERLEEKWKNKAIRHVGRPSSTTSTTDYSAFTDVNVVDNRPSNQPFFEEIHKDHFDNENTSNAISRTSQNIKRKNTEAQNKARQAADQESIFELWQEEPMYTFKWFKYLMELQFADNTTETHRIVQIDFNTYEILDNGRFVKLMNPSNTIPMWIENADSVDISVIGTNSIKIQASIVKIEESGIIIKIDPNIYNKQTNARKIRIIAESNTNIIDSLTTRFLQLDYEADAIKQMTDNRPLDTETCKVLSGTVHKFQGDECDIMFIVLNPPIKVTSGSHINNDNIINVAMSRARDYIFFILPEGKIDGFNVKNKLNSIIDVKDRTIQYCSEIEGIMFGNNNHIYENTNISCHLPVNVYYDTYAKYEVRMDDTTLDIQINE